MLELWISKRYLRPKGKEGFFSVITLISFLGIASSVAVLVVVMSVMNGFRTELINKIVNINGHILIYPTQQEGIKNFESIESKINDFECSVLGPFWVSFWRCFGSPNGGQEHQKEDLKSLSKS